MSFALFVSPLTYWYSEMLGFTGKVNKPGFDAHWAFVRPVSNNPDEAVFYPADNMPHKYTECVTFTPQSCMPRFVVMLQRAATPGRGLGVHQVVFGAVGSISLQAAVLHVYDLYLSMAYQPDILYGDRVFEHNGAVVERPNHGLAHTLRTMAYLPVCVRLFLHSNVLPAELKELITRSVPSLQLALLSYVACRENEASSFDDAAAYTTFRDKSAYAFWDYADSNAAKLAMPDPIQHRCMVALQNRGYDASNWIQTLITMAHDMDLLRTLDGGIYDGIASTWMPFVGAQAWSL